MARRKLRLKGMAFAVALCLLFQQVASASTFTLVSDVAPVDGFAPVFMQGGFAVPVELAAVFGADVRAEGERYVITYLGTATAVGPGDERAITPAGERVLQPRPFFAGDTLFVPLSFLADILRLRVSWSPASNYITLTRWASPLMHLVAPQPGDSVPTLAGRTFARSAQGSAPAQGPGQGAAQSPSQVSEQGAVQAPAQASVQEAAQAPAQTPPVVSAQAPAQQAVQAAIQVPERTPVQAAMEVLEKSPVQAAVQIPVPAPVPIPALPRPAARFEAPFGLNVHFPQIDSENEDEEPASGPAEEAAAAAEIWPSLFEATGIAVRRSMQEGQAVYEFETEGPLEATTAVLVEPFRLVVDLEGGMRKPGAAVDPLPVGDGMVRQLRASLTEEGLRVVFDMEMPLGHKVERVGEDRVRIRLLRPFKGIAVEAEEYGGRILLDIPAETPFVISRLVQPDRIVIDLFEATVVPGPVSVELESGPVTRVRAAQFLPDVARVVLDVTERVEIEPVSASGRIAFLYGDAVAPIAYRTASSGIDIRINAGRDADVRVARLSGPDRLVIDVTPMSLGVALQDVMIPAGPVYRLRASQYTADTVRIVADLRYYVQYALHQDERHTIVALRQPSLAGRTITVDAGHGGIDVGAISPTYGLTEKEVNLDIALRLGELIAGAEGTVHLTRSDDAGIGASQRDGLMERVRFASQSDADVFVSIHNNSALLPGPTARGTETFYRSDDPQSKALAESVQAGVVSALGTVDRGIIDNRTRGYFVLRYIDKPAILVEVAFLSHPEEEELLRHDWFRQRAAEGIFNGLLKYFHPGDRLDESPLHLTGSEAWLRMPARQE